MPWAAFASRSAVAGATTTRSAACPIRTCGTSWTSAHTSAETGLPDSADQVGAPTKASAAAVGTTVTSWPLSVSRRSSSQLLYAAMPPLTPRTTRGDAFTGWLTGPEVTSDLQVLGGRAGVGLDRSRLDDPGLDLRLDLGLGLGVVLLGGQQVLVDLAERDRQRLLLHVSVHERADVLQQPLAELRVVGVDLPRALGGVEDQAVLGVGLGQELVDGRVGDALGDRGSRHVVEPHSFDRGWSVGVPTSAIKATNSSPAR